jgi:hypothetical protein
MHACSLRKGEKFIILGLQVDDPLMVRKDDFPRDNVVNKLRQEIIITDLGEPTRIVEIRITRDAATGAVTFDRGVLSVSCYSVTI